MLKVLDTMFLSYLRWFQRGRLKLGLDEDLKFSIRFRFRISVPTEWRSQKTIDRPVSTVFNRKVGENCIGSSGNLEKWPTICWVLIFNVWLKLDEGKKLFHVKIGILGTIWSSLPIIYRLVILKHLKNKGVLMINESNQQWNENLWFKIHLAVKRQDLWGTTQVTARKTWLFPKLWDF